MAMDNPWQEAKKVLCIRLDSLGDVLMTTPAMRALKQASPGRTITLLASPAGAKAAPLIPELDSVIVYEAPWMKATRPNDDSSQEYRIASELRKRGFDAAVIFTVFSQNPLPAALLAYLADIPLRLAYCRENPYQLLTLWAPETDTGLEEPARHEVRRHLDLVALTGAVTPDETLSLQAPPQAMRYARQALEKLGVELSCPWAVIHPGASAASRRYRPEGFAAASSQLASEHGVQIVFTGSREEVALVRSIQSAMTASSASLAGKLDLAEMAAVLALAPLLISNNTGPVHMASALGTPVVDLYALTNPQHTPWKVTSRVLSHDVDCKYCYKSVCPLGHNDCLQKIPPEAVVQAALELLAEAALYADGRLAR